MPDFFVSPESFSLIIPTLNASWDLPGLLERIGRQTLRPHEVIVVDSSSDDETVEIARAHEGEGVRIFEIMRESFNHGMTRHEALMRTEGEFVCFMTQDAVPANPLYFEYLLAMFADPEVAMVTGRQLPKPDARRFEQLVREFNYGPNSNVRSAEDIPALGIKAFFASDVCSAVRRSSYLKCGGFPKLDTNEDMYMAARLLGAGFKVAYSANALVFHSHNLSPTEQFWRNKGMGEFIARNRSLLAGAEESREGVRLASMVVRKLLVERRYSELLSFGVDCFARIAGNRIGRKQARRPSSASAPDMRGLPE